MQSAAALNLPGFEERSRDGGRAKLSLLEVIIIRSGSAKGSGLIPFGSGSRLFSYNDRLGKIAFIKSIFNGVAIIAARQPYDEIAR